MRKSSDTDIRIALYGKEKTNDISVYLEEGIKITLPQCLLDRYQSISVLSEALGDLQKRIGVAILIISDKSELCQFILMEDLLEYVSIVLILASDEEDMLRDAHALRPRLLVQNRSELSSVPVVVRNLFLRQLPMEQ